MTSTETEFRKALSALKTGRSADAERGFKTVLRAQPRHLGALNLLGVVLTQSGRFAEAEIFLRRALRENATSDATLYNYGIVLKSLGRADEALTVFDQALSINPNVAETWNNRGTVYNDLRQHQEAIADFDRAMALQPRYAEAFCNKGNALAALNRLDEALAAFDRAAALRPELAEAWLGRARALQALGRNQDANAAYRRALECRSDLLEAWLGCGNTAFELSRHGDALDAYDRMLALEPMHAGALASRGAVLLHFAMVREGFEACDRAFELDPTLPYLEGNRLSAKRLICSWDDLNRESAHLLAAVRNGKLVTDPFPLLAIPSLLSDQRQCAELYVRHRPTFAPLWRGEVYSHDRIRIAYLSADFHEHATAYLMAGLFEHHDRTRFEVTGISFGPDDGSPIRKRVQAGVEHFWDAREESDEAIAAFVRAHEIDIAVDLKGLTENNRFGVFARRAAPVQVSYLGYPGTTGTDYIDYLVADATTVPEEHWPYYAEKVVWLPDTYQANDDKRRIAEEVPSRSACGLPDEGFVFCCFNNTFKITPQMFDIWMRLLGNLEGSVLWLYEGNSAGTATLCGENLRREAERRGVAGERIVFAAKTNLAEHLARHRLADLFLDTLPYNAQTTASDALWAGLPVLTCLGATFAGRVAASLLKAAGLPELITESLQDYEGLALKLARDAALLASVKAKLAGNRTRRALFDTARFTRHIEAAYRQMWRRHRNGEAPAAFRVAAHTAGGEY